MYVSLIGGRREPYSIYRLSGSVSYKEEININIYKYIYLYLYISTKMSVNMVIIFK